MAKYKSWFGMACIAVAIGLAFSLTACEGDGAMSSSRSKSDENTAEWDSLSQIDALNPETLLHCDRNLAVDGLIVARYSGLGNFYYKCEDDKWSPVPADDVANKDSVILLASSTQMGERHFYMFQKCETDNEGMIDSTIYSGTHGIRTITYYKCEKGRWKVVPESGVCYIAEKAIFCEDYDPSSVTGPSAEMDSAYCDTLEVAAPPYVCSESLQVDGYYYSFTGFLYLDLGGCTFKCQHNEWSVVPAKNVPEDAKKFTDYDVANRTEEVGKLKFKKCNAENEGIVDSSWIDNPKYGRMMYYKCENGSWGAGGLSATCDTAGVPVGAFCRKKSNVGFFNQLPWTGVYVYEGEGAWMQLLLYRADGDTSVSEDIPKKFENCSAKNRWDKEKIVYGVGSDTIALYYMCVNGGWKKIDEVGYHCTTESTDVGDTCSFVSGDSTQHYIFMYTDDYRGRSYYGNIWVKSSVDPELGYCPQVSIEPEYVQKDGKFYYCNYGKWRAAGFVPRQEADPRKEGLTDKEYDVLELPKEAEVGDRVGGLLEYCFVDVELDLGGPDEWRYETYDFCMPQNYYRYRDNGTWTLETEDDLKMNNAIPCTAGTEGVEYTLLPRPREPGRIFKRTRVQCDPITDPNSIIKEQCSCADALVDHIFGRSEKK